ncbi:nucleoside deaminase [Ornithinibacillus sp. 4-3]|uniref:Nucleoside deaminase n=1 Tax=Ornithinibacillus sp. 4-3 TaxID=3231488 RepID=A0AB39HS14_9BACI
MDQFMRRAAELALKNVQEGGDPFGAVLVKDGEIISEGVNELHFKYDSSGHAELLAIRRAQEKLQTHDLSDHIMYASGEPCPMCLAAMYMAGIEEGYYGISIEETATYGMGRSVSLYADFAKPRKERQLKMRQMPLTKEIDNPMQVWKKNKDVK